jgi:hypothetical protein
VRGLFQRLARDGVDQAFVRVEVAGGLVQAQTGIGVLLDQQEAAVLFNDGRLGSWQKGNKNKALL